ncbi:hypothetical protein AMTRI_Chr13g119200 [Amborella trichopoda]
MGVRGPQRVQGGREGGWYESEGGGGERGKTWGWKGRAQTREGEQGFGRERRSSEDGGSVSGSGRDRSLCHHQERGDDHDGGVDGARECGGKGNEGQGQGIVQHGGLTTREKGLVQVA